MKLINITERAESVLGIKNEMDDKQIKKAYYEKVKQFHPDINGKEQTDKMALIIEAYGWISGLVKKEGLLKDDKLIKEITGKSFDNEKSYEEWHRNQFYGYGVI